MVTTTKDRWHPRGTPTWPDWKQGKEGQRVEHVRSGMQGTFQRAIVGKTAGTRFAVIAWDGQPGLGNGEPVIGRVVAPAFDLRPIE